MAITIERVHPRFGATIAGVDLARPLDDVTFADIRAAFDEDSLLIFHGRS